MRLLVVGAALVLASVAVAGRGPELWLTFEPTGWRNQMFLNVQARQVRFESQGRLAWEVPAPALLTSSLTTSQPEYTAYRRRQLRALGPFLEPLAFAGGVVVATRWGEVVMAEHDGAVLLEAPLADEKAGWDEAAVYMRGSGGECRTAMRWTLLTQCGDRVVHISGGVVHVLAPDPWRVESVQLGKLGGVASVELNTGAAAGLELAVLGVRDR
jgi:hypothetical protein